MLTLQEWQNLKIQIENSHNCSIFGSCVVPCPKCHTKGFFSPRQAQERKYLACKFCGFWQEVGGESYFCIQIYCLNCSALGWIKPNEETHCPNCGQIGGEQKLGVLIPAPESKENPMWAEKLKLESRHQKNYNLFKSSDKAALFWIGLITIISIGYIVLQEVFLQRNY